MYIYYVYINTNAYSMYLENIYMYIFIRGVNVNALTHAIIKKIWTCNFFLNAN